jgi:hypothetical protein
MVSRLWVSGLANEAVCLSPRMSEHQFIRNIWSATELLIPNRFFRGFAHNIDVNLSS